MYTKYFSLKTRKPGRGGVETKTTDTTEKRGTRDNTRAKVVGGGWWMWAAVDYYYDLVVVLLVQCSTAGE
jgi:hypothetical protein